MFGGISSSLDSALVGSPLKKPRSSLGDVGVTSAPIFENGKANGLPTADVLGAAESGRLEPKTFIPVATNGNAMVDDDEEL